MIWVEIKRFALVSFSLFLTLIHKKLLTMTNLFYRVWLVLRVNFKLNHLFWTFYLRLKVVKFFLKFIQLIFLRALYFSEIQSFSILFCQYFWNYWEGWITNFTQTITICLISWKLNFELYYFWIEEFSMIWNKAWTH